MQTTSLEDVTSRELHEERCSRRLKQSKKNRPPPVHHDTSHGIMIDAGSQGTRLHVYEFQARILSHRSHIKHAVQGRKLTFPTTDSRWTDRMKPGLDAFAWIESDKERHEKVQDYLKPLLNFAEQMLLEKKHKWKVSWKWTPIRSDRQLTAISRLITNHPISLDPYNVDLPNLSQSYWRLAVAPSLL
jgi:hypothetical protein